MVESEVPTDLFIVCQILSSKIINIFVSFLSHSLIIFSLTLSKMIITSLIPYPIIVKIAIINTVSIWIVEFVAIRIPYAPAGILILKIVLNTTTTTRIDGLIYFLTEPNEKII